ncbi:hypothetical protein IGI39_001733 [Enterococcus sp. AZ135]
MIKRKKYYGKKYESHRASHNDHELYGLLQQWALSTKIKDIDTDRIS